MVVRPASCVVARGPPRGRPVDNAADGARREQKGHWSRPPERRAAPWPLRRRCSTAPATARRVPRRFDVTRSWFQTRATCGFTARAALAGASSSRERILGPPTRLGVGLGQPKGGDPGHLLVSAWHSSDFFRARPGRAKLMQRARPPGGRGKDAPGASRPATTPPAPQTTTPRMPPSPKYHFPPPVVAPTAGQPSQLSKQGSAARGPLGAARRPGRLSFNKKPRTA